VAGQGASGSPSPAVNFIDVYLPPRLFRPASSARRSRMEASGTVDIVDCRVSTSLARRDRVSYRLAVRSAAYAVAAPWMRSGGAGS